MRKLNDATETTGNPDFYWVPAEITRAQEQVVAGANYFIEVFVQKSDCASTVGNFHIPTFDVSVFF